jgi:hypothetical protein
MANIAETTRQVKSLQRTLSDWPRRKLREQTDSASELERKLNSFCAGLQQFCADQATTQQAQFLKDRGFPVLASLEHSLRRMRILAEKADEVRL